MVVVVAWPPGLLLELFRPSSCWFELFENPCCGCCSVGMFIFATGATT